METPVSRKRNFTPDQAATATEPGRHTPSTQWVEDCLRWRGVVLTGEYAHWCFEYDDLPMDETCYGEWPCGCSIQMPDGTVVDTMELARVAIAKASGHE